MLSPAQEPAQGEGGPGAGDEPGGVLRGEGGQPCGLGDGQLDGGDPGRAGLAAEDRDRCVAEGEAQVSVAIAVRVRIRGRGRSGAVCVVAGGGDGAVQGVSDGGLAELGQGGQGGVPADPVPDPDLGLVPAEDVFARFERFFYSYVGSRWCLMRHSII
jgi:hypothetical protein